MSERQPISAPSDKSLEDFFRPLSSRESYPGTELPFVRAAPQFRRNAFPLVIGQPDKARLVEMILDRIPEARGSFDKMVFGPTSDVVNELLSSKFSPYDYERTNLLGLTSYPKREISINPRIGNEFDNAQLLDTIVHEIKHAHGFSPENEADEAGLFYPRELRSVSSLERKIGPLSWKTRSKK